MANSSASARSLSTSPQHYSPPVHSNARQTKRREKRRTTCSRPTAAWGFILIGLAVCLYVRLAAQTLLKPTQTALAASALVKQPDYKRTRVAVVLRNCSSTLPNPALEEECLTRLLKKCGPFGGESCYKDKLLPKLACRAVGRYIDRHVKWKIKHSYMLGIRRAVPELRKLGWSQINIVSLEGNEDASLLQQADLVIVFAGIALNYDNSQGEGLLQKYPHKSFILLDTLDSGSLYEKIDPSPPQIKAVLRTGILHPVSLNNRFDPAAGAAHMTFLQGTSAQREPPIHDRDLAKMVPLLPLIFAWRYPLDCAGNLQFARFAGFFRHDTLLWNPKRLEARSYDVAFVGAVVYNKSPVIQAHRLQLVRQLKAFRSKHHGKLKVVIGEGSKAYDHHHYLKLLQNTKVFISPYGNGEWSYKDFEAIMSGCVVVKPDPASYIAYPNIYQDGVTMIGVKTDFSDLEAKLLPLLSDLDLGQELVAAGQELLRRYSSIEHYAQHLDMLLANITSQGLPIMPDVT